MSVMSRPSLPTFQSTPIIKKDQLPPLSSLLNDEQKTPIKTPIRLPSFDSINFNQGLKPLSSIPTPSSQPHLLPPHQPQFIQSQQSSISPLVEKRSYAFISHSPSTFPLQEPSIDNQQLARRKRRRTSPLELSILQNEFEKGSTPNRTRRLEIAKRVNMTEKAIQIWFQNRRQTLRRQSNAEREIHHIEPIYIPHLQHQDQTPIKQSHGMIYQTPAQEQEQQQQQNHQQNSYPVPTSSPMKINTKITEQPSSSPSSSSPTSSPLHQQQTPAKTPSPSHAHTSPVGSTYTFKLSKPSPTKQRKPLVQISNNSFKIRQKPVMKVNPSPHNKNDVKDKENISPIKKKQKLGKEDNAIENLLNLRNWK